MTASRGLPLGQRCDDGPTMPQSPLPDVNADASPIARGRLDAVGMAGIECAVRVAAADGSLQLQSARADIHVSLDDPAAKGIHMSRLYLALTRALDETVLSPATARGLIGRILDESLSSHGGLSSTAEVVLRFDHLVRRAALVSPHRAWRAYPVELRGRRDGPTMRLRLATTVVYSSTCPSSAALSRQAMAERFLAEHQGAVEADAVAAWLSRADRIAATPHAQRSDARIEIEPTAEALWFDALIDLAEDALATPVQAAVKRADEQEFARRNAANLMFCEDAARRLAQALDQRADLADWQVSVAHRESLHPHDAVASVAKHRHR
jgi:GTP cyclohydrolase I